MAEGAEVLIEGRIDVSCRLCSMVVAKDVTKQEGDQAMREHRCAPLAKLLKDLDIVEEAPSCGCS